jgi:predicted thioesterase
LEDFAMKDSLAVGIANEAQVTTTPEMGVSHLGEGPGVLSTPSMIGIMEQTCLQSLLPHLDENEQSVGTMVHIWHRAAAQIGEEVTCRCKLIEQDRRKLLFEVEVSARDQKIGDGTHERFVINLDKFNKS